MQGYKRLWLSLACLLSILTSVTGSAQTKNEPLDHIRLAQGLTPDVAVDALGNVHVAYKSGTSLYYTKLDAAGKVIVPGKEVYGIKRITNPRIAVDKEGKAHIIASIFHSEFLIYVKINANGKKSFHKPVSDAIKLVRAGYENIIYAHPDIAIDPTTQEPMIVAVRTWQQNKTITGIQDCTYLPIVGPICLGTPDVPISVSYEQLELFRLDEKGEISSRRPIYKRRNGGSILAGSEFPAITIDSQSIVHCVWSFLDKNDRLQKIAYRSSPHSQSLTDDPQIIPGSQVTVGHRGRPGISLGGDDRLHVAWRQQQKGTTDIRYTRLSREGQVEFTAPLLPYISLHAATATSAPSMAVDDDLIRIVWRDGRENRQDIYFSAIDIKTNAVLSKHRLTSGPSSKLNPAIGIGPSGIPAIVWQDSRYGGFHILALQPLWNFLLYLNGDNEREYLALEAFDRIELGAYNPLVRTLVQYDGTGENDSHRIRIRYNANEDKNINKLMENYQLENVNSWTIGEANMGDPKSLTSFVQWATETFPSKHTILSIVAPGNGWMGEVNQDANGNFTAERAFSFDKTSAKAFGPGSYGKAFMDLKELSSALETGKVALDILFLDSPYMGMIETAYELRDRSKFILFSEADTISGPYDDYVKGIQNEDEPDAASSEDKPNPAEQLVTNIAEDYHNRAGNQDHTISGIRTERIHELNQLVSELSHDLLVFPEFKPDHFEALRVSQKFDEAGRCVDLYDYFNNIQDKLKTKKTVDDNSSKLNELIGNVQVILDRLKASDNDSLIIKELDGGPTIKEAGGLSIYFPISRLDLEIADVPEESEEDPGAFIALSNDEDPKLVRAFIRFPSNIKEGVITLERSSDTIQIWADKDRTEAVLVNANVKTWNLSVESERSSFNEIKNHLWVEGIDVGEADLSLRFVNSAGVQPLNPDITKITVFRVEIKGEQIDPIQGKFENHGFLCKGQGQEIKFTVEILPKGIPSQFIDWKTDPSQVGTFRTSTVGKTEVWWDQDEEFFSMEEDDAKIFVSINGQTGDPLSFSVVSIAGSTIVVGSSNVPNTASSNPPAVVSLISFSKLENLVSALNISDSNDLRNWELQFRKPTIPLAPPQITDVINSISSKPTDGGIKFTVTTVENAPPGDYNLKYKLGDHSEHLVVFRLKYSSRETKSRFLYPFRSGDDIAGEDDFRFLVDGNRPICIKFSESIGGIYKCSVESQNNPPIPPVPSFGSFVNHCSISFQNDPLIPPEPNFGSFVNRCFTFTPTMIATRLQGKAINAISYLIRITDSSGNVILTDTISQDLIDRMRQEYLDAALGNTSFGVGNTGLVDGVPPRSQVGLAPSQAVGGYGIVPGCKDGPFPNYKKSNIGLIWNQGFVELFKTIEENETVCLHSGHRSPSHNISAKGVTNSNHQWGKALDISYPKAITKSVEKALSHLAIYRAALKGTNGTVLLERNAKQLLPNRWNPPPSIHTFERINRNDKWKITVADNDKDGLPDTVSMVTGSIPSSTNLVWGGLGSSNPPLRINDANGNKVIDKNELLVVDYNNTSSSLISLFGVQATHVHAVAD